MTRRVDSRHRGGGAGRSGGRPSVAPSENSRGGCLRGIPPPATISPTDATRKARDGDRDEEAVPSSSLVWRLIIDGRGTQFPWTRSREGPHLHPTTR
jgi:hypothetical protein